MQNKKLYRRNLWVQTSNILSFQHKNVRGSFSTRSVSSDAFSFREILYVNVKHSLWKMQGNESGWLSCTDDFRIPNIFLTFCSVFFSSLVYVAKNTSCIGLSKINLIYQNAIKNSFSFIISFNMTQKHV